jgi:hypothetical protein
MLSYPSHLQNRSLLPLGASSLSTPVNPCHFHREYFVHCLLKMSLELVLALLLFSMHYGLLVHHMVGTYELFEPLFNAFVLVSV